MSARRGRRRKPALPTEITGALTDSALAVLDAVAAEWDQVDVEVWGQPGRTRAIVEHYIRFGPDPVDQGVHLAHRAVVDGLPDRPLPAVQHDAKVPKLSKPCPPDASPLERLRWAAAAAAYDHTDTFG